MPSRVGAMVRDAFAAGAAVARGGGTGWCPLQPRCLGSHDGFVALLGEESAALRVRLSTLRQELKALESRLAQAPGASAPAR